MQVWGGGDSGEERKTSFLTPRTSCLTEKPEKLYIELWEWLNGQQGGSQCGLHATLGRQKHSHWSLLATKLSKCLLKKKKSWVNFNSQTTWQSGQRLATKGKASPKGWVIPLSLCGLYNLLCEGFFQMKQFSQFCTYSNININYNIPTQKMVGRAEGYFPLAKTSLCCIRELGRSHQYSSQQRHTDSHMVVVTVTHHISTNNFFTVIPHPLPISSHLG